MPTQISLVIPKELFQTSVYNSRKSCALALTLKTLFPESTIVAMGSGTFISGQYWAMSSEFGGIDIIKNYAKQPQDMEDIPLSLERDPSYDSAWPEIKAYEFPDT